MCPEKLACFTNLRISARQDVHVRVEVNSWLDDNQTFLFTELRLVEISRLSGIKVELDFIGLLLSSSPVLERMTIASIAPGAVADAIYSELLNGIIQFKWASENAEIIDLGI